jgi:hypothetical protein
MTEIRDPGVAHGGARRAGSAAGGGARTTARTQPTAPSRPVDVAAGRRPRPDPRPMRIVIGMTGLATISALATAILAPAPPAGAATALVTTDGAASPAPGQVRQVTRYVQLQPGQTAPPSSTVKVQPTPTPRVVVVQTRQSGTP